VVVRQKISAGRAAFAVRNHMLIGPVGVHHENLVALQLVARRLEDQPLAVRSPISLSVLAAEGELFDVRQVLCGLRNSPQPSECN